MATTVDLVSILAIPSRREALARAARQRVVQVPAAPVRSRQVGLEVVSHALVQSAQPTGIAAYARQKEQYALWRDAADSRPIREITVTGVPKDRAIGTQLDLRM